MCERVCRASNILFFKLKNKKNQPNLERESERARENECARAREKTREPVESAKTATISQSHANEKRIVEHEGKAKKREREKCELPALSELAWRGMLTCDVTLE